MNLNRVVGAPAGIIRVRVSGADWSDTVVRKTARSYAMREAHTLVGGAQNVRQDGADTLVDFAVVTRTAKDAHPADTALRADIERVIATHTSARVTGSPVPVSPTGELVRPVAAPVAVVGDLLDQIAALQAQVAALAAQVSGKPAPVAKPAPKPREVPAFIVARAQAREAAACKLCLDFGVVRAAGPNAGQPYKTANGAAGASASKPCTCKSGKRAAKRTA